MPLQFSHTETGLLPGGGGGVKDNKGQSRKATASWQDVCGKYILQVWITPGIQVDR